MNSKYFTCFGFTNFDVADLDKFHVTHTYFGHLNTDQVNAIIFIINKYLQHSKCHPSWPLVGFNKVDMFGPNKDIRVLRPPSVASLDISFLGELRSVLEDYQTEGECYPFNPHLTTDLVSFKGMMDYLYLCKDEYEVVKAWRL